MIPGNSMSTSGFGAAYKKQVRDQAGAFIQMGAFGEMLPRYENYVEVDPNTKDRWGIPVLRFHIKFGDNERAMAADMADSAKEMFEEAGIEIVSVNREILTEGWSIHELGTSRMGNDPKTSVLNQFQQSHDVKNLFVVDGSSHVSASCQNPTWTIMALCWRSCDSLADQLKKGEI
jgi:choline dehydrogenase-like flavoprotein